MTIKQFLDLEKQKEALWEYASLRFRFKDKQDIVWCCNGSASEFSGFCILELPCDLKCKKRNLYTFDLDLNAIPKNLNTNLWELWELPAQKNDGVNVPVQEYLQTLQKEYDKENQPKVFFCQKILMKDSDGRENTYSFTTQDAASLEEAANGPFSHLLIKNIKAKDDSIVIELLSSANERIHKKKEETSNFTNERVHEKKEETSSQEEIQTYEKEISLEGKGFVAIILSIILSGLIFLGWNIGSIDNEGVVWGFSFVFLLTVYGALKCMYDD